MKAEEIVLGSFEPRTGSPFAIYFVYAPEGNFVVKGMGKDVSRYVRTHFPRCFFRYTFWLNGKSRGGWASTLRIYFCTRSVRRKMSGGGVAKNRHNLIIVFYAKDGRLEEDALFFRRFPRRWIPEMDKALGVSAEGISPSIIATELAGLIDALGSYMVGAD